MKIKIFRTSTTLMVGSGVFDDPSKTQSDSFYRLDLSVLHAVYDEWNTALPHVKPHYAVKCNPTPEIIKTLVNLGSNFDCASPVEIQTVLDAGAGSERIIYANPCKRVEDIVFAKERGVCLSTFDSECELRKMAQYFPECKLILRIRADDPKARCPLGNKYGAEERDWDVLLFTARTLGIDVVGVSFHVGSFASSTKVFNLALAKAKKAMRLAKRHGYHPSVIDIGGGFSSASGLPKNIKCEKGVHLIAEPGRFFVERAVTLYTPVIGVKGTGITISESLYGAFNCIKYDHADPQVSRVLDEFGNKIEGSPVTVTIFGSTCDGSDTIHKEYQVPEGTGYGSWLVWDNMGAYTCAAASNFNGLPFGMREILNIK